MHLNAIRLEGKMGSEQFFNIADRMGVLILAGWCCGNRWESWPEWKPKDYAIAYDSLRSQIRRLRHHASLALWMNGSDHHPPLDVEAKYQDIIVKNGWPDPYISSATSVPTALTGATGVKMTGPYDYVPPSYWLVDTSHFGGAFGFNTETSPGAAIPVKESLEKFLPAGKLWPINRIWGLHAGAGNLNDNVDHFNASMDAIYGAPVGLDDYLRKAQAMAYDGERAMFEAYARNRYRSTGVIQWMLNNGWPSIMWHLYDYYLQPAGGYFGVKKACEPVHIQYSYDDRSVVIVNSLFRPLPGMTAEVSAFDFGLKELFARKLTLDVATNSVRRILVIPDEVFSSRIVFLRLVLKNGRGRVVSTNFYWLPSRNSEFDWSLEQARAHPYYTAVKSYEDLTMLNRLPEVALDGAVSARELKGGEEVRVSVRNPSRHLAFQIHLSLVNAETGKEVLPVLWEDNYISLMPGETRKLVVHYEFGKDVGRLRLRVGGWNIKSESVPVQE